MINESKYLDYQPGHPLFVAGKPKLALISAVGTLIASLVPVWFNYADVRVIPAYIGWWMLLLGIYPLWKARPWGSLCALLGLLLLLADLVLINALVALVIWHHVGAVSRLDIWDISCFVAALLDISTIVLLARRMRRMSKQRAWG
jgi:hypothetical protein